MTAPAPRHPHPVDAAVEFLTVPGRAERILAVHYDRGDGRCAGCWESLAQWPCSTARLAQLAVLRRAGPGMSGDDMAHTHGPATAVCVSCAFVDVKAVAS